MTIHHATLAKAEKLGITMTEDQNASQFGAYWAEKNKRAYVAFGAGAAAALLSDMQALQMITREYPNLKATQPHWQAGNFVWEVAQRGKVIGEGVRLSDALDDAIDTISKKASKNGASNDDIDEELAEEEEEEDEANDDEVEEEQGKSIVKRKYKKAYRPFKMKCGDELSQLISAHVTVEDEDGKHIDPKKLHRFAKQNGVYSDNDLKLNIGQQRMNIGNRLRGKVRKNPDYEIVWN